MGVNFDTSQVDALSVDLSRAPQRLQRAARFTMKKSALRIKERMQEDFTGHRYARGVPLSLEFQQRDRIGLSFEIGELDSAGRQWGLAAILAYGTSNNTPVVDHRASLRREAPIMVNHLGADAEDAVLRDDE